MVIVKENNCKKIPSKRPSSLIVIAIKIFVYAMKLIGKKNSF
jgi:hypothetical protein